MRRHLYIILTSVAALASCKEDTLPKVDTGSISLIILSGSQEEADRSMLKQMAVYLFSSREECYLVYRLSTEELSEGKVTIDGIEPGDYHAYAIANGPEITSLTDEEEFRAVRMPLEEFNSEENGFVMGSGRTSVSISPEEVTHLSVSLKRYVSRVRLKEIRNELPSGYGMMKINYAVLNNVVGVQTMDGTVPAGGWLNIQGVADESHRDASHIIGTDEFTASCPSLTFAGYSADISAGEVFTTEDAFYGYANNCAVSPSGFTSEFSGERSTLTVSVSFGGQTWFYPVVLSEGMLPNSTYDIVLTITGEGSPDPNLPVATGSFRSLVNVSQWDTNPEYNECF